MEVSKRMDQEVCQNKERSLWDKLAESYDRRTLVTYQKAYDLSIQKVRETLTSDMQVFEIGCGTGIISLGIAGEAARVVGTDLSSQMIRIARQKAAEMNISKVEFKVCDGYSQPYKDGHFDMVLLFNVVHLVKEPGALLKEAHRLLKPGGLLLTATDCFAEKVSLKARLHLLVERIMKALGIIPFIWFLSIEDYKELVAANGFEVQQVENLHPVPVNCYIKARKKA